MKQRPATSILSCLFLILPLVTMQVATAEDSDSSDSILSETNTLTQAPVKTPSKAPPETNNANKVKDFSFIDLDGKPHDFKEYRGKWVIVNYWAPYCPPCRVEVTDLELFFRDHKNNAVILGMDASGDPVSELKQFKKEYELSYTMAAAQQSTLLSFGIIDALPTTFIVSPQGEIINKHIGMITYDDLDYYINPKKPKNKQAKK